MDVFKAYDVRGRYPEEVNEKLAYNIGRAMVVLLEAKDFLVCQDAREGSKELSDALIKGVTDQGADVTYAGLVTTPMFYYFKWKKGFDAGVIITASHLPRGFNGLKAVKGGREFMSYNSGYKEVEELIHSGGLEKIALADSKGTVKQEDYINEYVDFVTKSAVGKLTGLKVVVDGSNGMAGPVAKQILEKVGVDYIGLNMDYNLDNPTHGLNPIKREAQKQVKKTVLETGAAFGAVFDADGDRIIFIDEKGEELPGDYALILLTKYLAKPGDRIVHDLLLGRAFLDVVKSMGCIPVISRVGHVFIKQTMIENDARVGGEIAGHMYLQEAGGAEATILCLLDMIGYLNKEQKPLSQLLAPLKEAWVKTEELNYELESNELKDKKIEEVAQEFSDGKQSRLDGITVNYDDYWFNVRKSNTEPVLRLRAEAKTRELLEDLVSRVENIINK